MTKPLKETGGTRKTVRSAAKELLLDQAKALSRISAELHSRADEADGDDRLPLRAAARAVTAEMNEVLSAVLALNDAPYARIIENLKGSAKKLRERKARADDLASDLEMVADALDGVKKIVAAARA